MESSRRIRLAVIGCGDVARRCYVPALRAMRETVDLVGCCDRDEAAADALAGVLRDTWPAVAGHADAAAMLDALAPDAAFDLTPAPAHGAVNRLLLDAGVHTFSEKPLASTVADGLALAGTAMRRGLVLAVAPAVMATPRFRLVARCVRHGRIGRPTFAFAHLANLGPAAWAQYGGDPAVFYGPDVGPLIDQGVYLLHAITGVLGPATSVRAVGDVAMPRRRVAGGPHAGAEVAVETADHVLLELTLATGARASVFSSFAVHGTRSPLLEIHGTSGSLHVDDRPPLRAGGAVELCAQDDPSRWTALTVSDPPGAPRDLIGVGPRHFVRCLLGRESSALTPERACHVLEIMLEARASLASGRPASLRTASLLTDPIDGAGRASSSTVRPMFALPHGPDPGHIAATVEISEVPKRRLRDAARLMQTVFGLSDANAVPAWEMHVATRHGALALGAFTRGELVGFSYAFPAVDRAGLCLYSNGLVVRPDVQSQGIGLRLKHEQGRLARERGFDRIRWTTNTLAPRALRLYLTGLGATLVGFTPALVEEFLDGIALDEAEICWDLGREPPVANAAAPALDDGGLLTTTVASARTSSRRLTGVRGCGRALEPAYWLELPWDWQRLRADDPRGLASWRNGVATAMAALLDAGHVGIHVLVQRRARRAYVCFARRGAR